MDEVKERIANLEDKTTLGVDTLGLKTLPSEIGELKNLEKLWCYNNQLIVLPPEIGELKMSYKIVWKDWKLIILKCCRTQIEGMKKY